MTTETRKTTERVIFIEYLDGRPSSIETTDRDDASYGDTYDVEWCKRDLQLYYHLSGCGPIREFHVSKGMGYWAAGGIAVNADDGARRLERAKGKKAFERILDGDWTQGDYRQSETEYCPTCDDYVPTGDTDSPCDHIWWCDEAGWWSKPGERCPWDCDACREEGRETEPMPPMIVVARGYGIAASPVASMTRRILQDRGLTPELLGERMGWHCDEKVEAVRMALRGEVDPRVTPRELVAVARKLDLDPDTERELMVNFGLNERRSNDR